jgi:hypothetical protein
LLYGPPRAVAVASVGVVVAGVVAAGVVVAGVVAAGVVAAGVVAVGVAFDDDLPPPPQPLVKAATVPSSASSVNPGLGLRIERHLSRESDAFPRRGLNADSCSV